MQALNFPSYQFSTRIVGERTEIFDQFRKKYVVLTPEEWVRQHLLRFLVEERSYPPGLISVEKSIDVNGLQRRYDAVVFDRSGKPLMIIECKAPSVAVTQQVFDQVYAYSMNIPASFYFISNGIIHAVVKKAQGSAAAFLDDIPSYIEINS